MSRTSCDQYRLPSGEIVNEGQRFVFLGQECIVIPEGSVLWNGYDYENQYWVHEGKRDTRTLEELKAAMTPAV